MLAGVERKSRKRLIGSPRPRLAPPRPLIADTSLFMAEAECLGIAPFDWQVLVAKYLNATAPNGKFLYPEVADIVSRRNGKSEIFVPHICARLRAGRKVVHTAQDRQLPREVYSRVVDHMVAKHSNELARKPRFANGQEQVVTTTGGSYRIIAPTRSSARGLEADDLILDEIREYDDHELIQAARPIVMSSPNPQIFYSSNAGSDASLVLNALRVRAGADPSLAYLEWSASPDRTPDDRKGWVEANPSLGHIPWMEENLEREYRAHLLSGTLTHFETENLCRWVASMERAYVDGRAWDALSRDEIGAPRVSWMGISMDASGERASAVLAWRNPDESVTLSVVADVTDQHVDPLWFGDELGEIARQFASSEAAYDPWTDADIARQIPRSKALNGRDYANASEAFVRGVERGMIRVKDDNGIIAADLRRLTRRSGPGGSYMAVKANDQEAATAGLAAIRAYWLATAQPPPALARIY